jgi:hypothetical protein
MQTTPPRPVCQAVCGHTEEWARLALELGPTYHITSAVKETDGLDFNTGGRASCEYALEPALLKCHQKYMEQQQQFDYAMCMARTEGMAQEDIDLDLPSEEDCVEATSRSLCGAGIGGAAALAAVGMTTDPQDLRSWVQAISIDKQATCNSHLRNMTHSCHGPCSRSLAPRPCFHACMVKNDIWKRCCCGYTVDFSARAADRVGLEELGPQENQDTMQ